jgi:peptidoglycan hydrolase CwlO-like protein
MDDAIDRAEKLVSSLSISDVNMKLVLTTARLTDNVAALSTTVSSLTNTVSTLATDVNSAQGVRGEMKDIRRDIKDTDQKVADVHERIASSMTVFWRVVWFLVLVGVVTVVTEIRSFAPILLGGGK